MAIGAPGVLGPAVPVPAGRARQSPQGLVTVQPPSMAGGVAQAHQPGRRHATAMNALVGTGWFSVKEWSSLLQYDNLSWLIGDPPLGMRLASGSANPYEGRYLVVLSLYFLGLIKHILTVDGGWSPWPQSHPLCEGLSVLQKHLTFVAIFRSCDNPPPSSKGKPCNGPNVKTHEQCYKLRWVLYQGDFSIVQHNLGAQFMSG